MKHTRLKILRCRVQGRSPDPEHHAADPKGRPRCAANAKVKAADPVEAFSVRQAAVMIDCERCLALVEADFANPERLDATERQVA